MPALTQDDDALSPDLKLALARCRGASAILAGACPWTDPNLRPGPTPPAGGLPLSWIRGLGATGRFSGFGSIVVKSPTRPRRTEASAACARARAALSAISAIRRLASFVLFPRLALGPMEPPVHSNASEQPTMGRADSDITRNPLRAQAWRTAGPRRLRPEADRMDQAGIPRRPERERPCSSRLVAP